MIQNGIVEPQETARQTEVAPARKTAADAVLAGRALRVLLAHDRQARHHIGRRRLLADDGRDACDPRADTVADAAGIALQIPAADLEALVPQGLHASLPEILAGVGAERHFKTLLEEDLAQGH